MYKPKFFGIGVVFLLAHAAHAQTSVALTKGVVAAPTVAASGPSDDSADVKRRNKKFLQHGPQHQRAAKPMPKTACDLDPKAAGCRK